MYSNVFTIRFSIQLNFFFENEKCFLITNKTCKHVEDVGEAEWDNGQGQIENRDHYLFAYHPSGVDDDDDDVVAGQLLLLDSDEVDKLDPASPVILVAPRPSQLVVGLLAGALFIFESYP